MVDEEINRPRPKHITLDSELEAFEFTQSPNQMGTRVDIYPWRPQLHVQ